MKIIGDIGASVPIDTMKDGDVAVITASPCPEHIGQIIQRYKIFLVNLGNHSDEGWGQYFARSVDTPNNGFLCRILPKGTKLEL